MSAQSSLSSVSSGLTAATAIAAAAMLVIRGLAFDWASALVPACFCLLLLAVIRFYTAVRPDERIVTTLSAIVQLIVFTAFGTALSYAVTSLPTPLWDATFHRWDRAFGFDWRAYLAFVNARPLLGRIEQLAYGSIMPQIVCLAALLGLTGRLGACRLLVAAFILAGLVSILVPAAMPAVGAYVELQVTPSSYAGLDVASGLAFVPVIEGLRTGTLHVVSLHGAQGLVTFPSYHAALGVLFAWGWSRLPWLRWPGIILNVALIAATPIFGGHYFVDLLAGFAVAAASLAGLRALAVWGGRRARRMGDGLSEPTCGKTADAGIRSTRPIT